MTRRQWHRVIIALALVSAVSMLYISVSTIMTEYDNAVHNSNSSAARCLQVSKNKAGAASSAVAAAITLNTLAIGIAVLAGARVASCVCCCFTRPESCQRACNWLAGLLYAALVVTVTATLANVDPTCHAMALALLMLLIVVPLTCCPIWVVARASQSTESDAINQSEPLTA
jgi:uncharacterized membrane protein AbrB (regulator of aidB expression)